MNTSIARLPRRIVLVDDETSVLFALKLLLEALGYEVADFSSPLKALEYLRSEPQTDLCLCDLRMPELTGLQLLEQLTKVAKRPPFVLMSAHATEVEMKKARSLGADGLLTKPFTPDDLERLIAQLFPQNLSSLATSQGAPHEPKTGEELE